MKIRKIVISNFRGIKELDWNLPAEDIFCLIGKGDSSKSTILDSIRFAFYPNWNLSLSDSDFHQCKTDDPIIIEISIGDLISEFCSLNKYGNYLRGWNINDLTLSDEPDDTLENILTIRLTIENDLEPRWRVVCNREPEGVEFRLADRNKVGVGVIGTYNEKQLSWSNGTALARLTNTQNLNESLASASRTARSSLDTDRAVKLKNFDEAANKSEDIAKILGVPVTDKFKAHLDLSSINIKIGGLALHDGEIPLRKLGLGSRRMLLCGIQQKGLTEGHITLFDEVEFGLEPHRIARLIKHIRNDQSGQYFLTTHSPVVLRELTVKELYIIHNNAGKVQVVATSSKSLVGYNVQGYMRSSSEAFLARKVLICEGATEVGFLRGLDDYNLNEGNDPFSYHGVALLNAGGGKKIKNLAISFQSLGYNVAVLADADAADQFSEEDVEEITKLGVKVTVWSDKLAIEERVMRDLPWESVLDCTRLAQDELLYPAYDQVRSKLGEELDRDISKWVESEELRIAIGTAAKKAGWFKDTTRGDMWFKIISPVFKNKDFETKDMFVKLDDLLAWVRHA